MIMNIRVLGVHLFGESATGVIARFCGSLAALLLLAECSLLRRRPCRARLRMQAQTVSQAGSMLPEIPATPTFARKPQKRTLTPVQLRNLG